MRERFYLTLAIITDQQGLGEEPLASQILPAEILFYQEEYKKTQLLGKVCNNFTTPVHQFPSAQCKVLFLHNSSLVWKLYYHFSFPKICEQGMPMGKTKCSVTIMLLLPPVMATDPCCTTIEKAPPPAAKMIFTDANWKEF